MRRSPHSAAPAAVAALAAVSLVALQGCSARKLVYGHLDTVLYRSIDSAFDLNARQKDFVEPRLDDLLAWHAREELPRYVVDLGELEKRVADGVLDKADADWFYGRLEAARVRLVDRTLPEAVAFLATVESPQVARLERKNAERAKEREERLAEGEEEFVERRATSFEKNLKPLLGRLTKEQRARIEAFARASWPQEAGRAAESRASQRRITAMLAGRPAAADIERAAREGVRSLAPGKNAYQARIRDLVVEVAALAGSGQRAAFVKEIRAWRADFEELHRKYGVEARTVGDTGAAVD